MTIIDFTQPGGYRLKQETFEKLQDSYFEILKSFIGYLGIPDAGNYILSGCKVVGPNITEGMMYIDGELCPFSGIVGDNTTKVKKNVALQSLVFQDASTPQVFRITSAVVDAAGAMLSTFNRLPPVQEMIWANIGNIPAALVLDAGYVHTDNNFTTAEQTKLAGIEPGAEVNVQADWTETNPAADSFVKNKPVLPLFVGTYDIGDIIGPGQLVTVNFPSVSTADYVPTLSFFSKHPDVGPLAGYAFDNDFNWVIRNKSASSFTIGFREYTALVQDIAVDFVLHPKS